MTFQDFIPILQIALGPVILISGIGLLLLTMTNRFGRVIDRTRLFIHESNREVKDSHLNIAEQITILLKRAHLLRAAIAFAAISILFVALLIILLFITALLQLEFILIVLGLFITCMVCLILSLILFICDINLSLTALKLEIGNSDK